MATSFESRKIHYTDLNDLNFKLSMLPIKELISVETCIPEWTTTNLQCVKIYYSYSR